MITLQEMMNGTPAKDELLQRNTSTKIRVAIPGIIKDLIIGANCYSSANNKRVSEY